MFPSFVISECLSSALLAIFFPFDLNHCFSSQRKGELGWGLVGVERKACSRGGSRNNSCLCFEVQIKASPAPSSPPKGAQTINLPVDFKLQFFSFTKHMYLVKTGIARAELEEARRQINLNLVV